ncbi:MAG: helix-turn-helix domain-containing protein [Actinomycetota bacterium]
MVTPAVESTTSSIERAFHLLQLVAAADEPLGVRELGRRSGLPRSTVSRLTTQLVELGMLTRSGVGGVTSGPALATLVPGGEAPPAALEDRLRPLLVECAQRFGESAALTVDTPDGALYLTHVPGPSAIQAPDPTGERLAFHLVAPGLAVMTDWDDDRLRTYTTAPLPAATPLTVTEPAALRALVRAGAAQGFVWADQAFDLEVNGVAVIVPGAEPTASISLYGPAYRLNPTDRSGLGEALRDLVSEWAPGLLGV